MSRQAPVQGNIRRYSLTVVANVLEYGVEVILVEDELDQALRSHRQLALDLILAGLGIIIIVLLCPHVSMSDDEKARRDI